MMPLSKGLADFGAYGIFLQGRRSDGLTLAMREMISQGTKEAITI